MKVSHTQLGGFRLPRITPRERNAQPRDEDMVPRWTAEDEERLAARVRRAAEAR